MTKKHKHASEAAPLEKERNQPNDAPPNTPAHSKSVDIFICFPCMSVAPQKAFFLWKILRGC